MGRKESSLSAVHIRGNLNQVVDYLSRIPIRQGEWELHLEVFMRVTQAFGVPQILIFHHIEPEGESVLLELQRD